MYSFTSCTILILLILTMSDVGVTNQVCYGELGCFSNDPPFDNANNELPDSPSEIKTKAYLWTKQNLATPQDISNTTDDSIKNSYFSPSRPTKVLIHGFHGSKDSSDVISKLHVAFLKTGDYNVIGIDWREGANRPYPKAVANTRVVGAVVAELLMQLLSHSAMKLSDLHVIGHSLGAHLSGYIGASVPGIDRITGLDPAGPMFANTVPEVRLDPTDALFVDVIHTAAVPLDELGLGTVLPMGHIDFYPNGGQIQPGCPTPNFSKSFSRNIACAHGRAVSYFIESVLNTTCQFTAKQCRSWVDFKRNTCDATFNVMGIHATKPSVNGSFYLRTNDQPPFCGPSETHNLAANSRSFGVFTLLITAAIVLIIG